ncbi:MAG: FCD domain-containing protein, partial [Pseudomonadota bacterium]
MTKLKATQALEGGDSMASADIKASERAADKLFRYFVEQIRSGDLREGATLPPEREIVETHGVSRTVVRETVQALANKGLVEARPRFRPVVRRPDFDAAFDTVDTIVRELLADQKGVKNLFDTRIMVEVSLVRGASRAASQTDLSALQAALVANEAAVDDNSLFFRTDVAFHGVLFQMSRNPLLMSLHRAYVSWLSPQWTKMPRNPERNANNYRAHRKVYDAVLARDADAAEDALRAHLD